MGRDWQTRAILSVCFVLAGGCHEYEPKKSPSKRPEGTAGSTSGTEIASRAGTASWNATDPGAAGVGAMAGSMQAGTGNAPAAAGATNTEAVAGTASDSAGAASVLGTSGTAGAPSLLGTAAMAGSAGFCAGGAAETGDVVVKLESLKQKISGFGASTAWYTTMSSADADLLWSTSSGAGLSLHRVRIDYRTGQTGELNIVKLAVARGARIWATPWTPPISAKSNGSEVEGTLVDGQAFATFLVNFVNYMKGQSVDVYAVSAQNEPDATVTYESCSFTAESLAAFVGTYMGPALANSGVKVMAPETQNWCGFPRYLNAILADPNATKYTDIIATHEYGCSAAAYPQIAQAGKEFWETEIYDTVTTADVGMGSALRVARLIHDALTIAEMNAWHYWWVYPATADNGALWDKATAKPSKRLWVMGNYSRFVRPGYRRVEIAGTAPTGVLVSAYTNPTDGRVAVVAINNNSVSTTLPLYLAGTSACAVTPWVTSESEALAAQAAVAVRGGRLSYLLAPRSVTTFVVVP